MPIPTADHAKWMLVIFQTTTIDQLVVSVLFRKYLRHQDPQIPKSNYYITLFSMWTFVVLELQQSSIFIGYGVLIFLKHSVYFSFLLFLIHFVFWVWDLVKQNQTKNSSVRPIVKILPFLVQTSSSCCALLCCALLCCRL